MHTTSFHRYLEELHQRFKPLDTGNVADYIPELSKANPDWFGIVIVTVDGHVYQVGDTQQHFSIQSISKAFTYGIALEDKGEDIVASKIDVEPSGEAFNSISLEPETGRPRNPMINAGAIVASSLVRGETGDEKLTRIIDKFSNFAGRTLDVDEAIYQSEKSTGHRNRAIAHLLRNYDILDNDPEAPLDAYFRQCSIKVTARDLAIMGATLANGGVNPITGIRALTARKVPSVLSVMATCGMYDYSGNWIHKVGMPAKSGVGGGIIAVLPGQLGLAVFSPRLDEKGNSVRGIAVCEAMSNDFGLHMLRVTRTTTSSIIRTHYTGAKVRSKLERDQRSKDILDAEGDRILVFELSGDMMFVSAEIVSTSAVDKMIHRSYLIIDLTRVTSIDLSATTMMVDLINTLGEEGKQVLFTGIEQHYHFSKHLDRMFKNSESKPVKEHSDVDHALEYIEDRLINESGIDSDDLLYVPLEQQPLCNNLDPDEQQLLRSLLSEESFEQGDTICHEDETANRMYFITSGRVSASLKLDHIRRHRLATSAAGSAFGESALFKSGTRSADVIADTTVKAFSFDPEDLRNKDDEASNRVMMKLLINLAELNAERVEFANEEIKSLTK